MAKPFKLLKGAMYANDIVQSDVADTIGRSPTYVATRMVNKGDWTIQEAYKILDLLNIPQDQIHTYFPAQEGKP